MASRSRTPYKTKNGLYESTEFGEVTVSNGDSVTMGNLIATANPYNVYLMQMSDGSEMTQTHAAGTNVVTITGAGTDVKCLYMNYGVKA